MTAELRSSQVAAAAGVSRQTLRYYERRGLLPEPERSLGGHRRYSAHAVTLIRVIKTAQRLGFSLTEVGDLLVGGRHRHEPGLHQRAQEKLAEVEAKIADLEVTASTLRAALDTGCHDLLDCAAARSCPLPFPELTQVS